MAANKKCDAVTTCLIAKTIRELLYANKTHEMMDYIEAMINTLEDPLEVKGLKELQMYHSNNFDALTDPYSRGIDIPGTIQPGIIHHARLGSMESNVFTLIGNRMKGGRAVWSIDGANNLSAILCAYHTSGLQWLFEPDSGSACDNMTASCVDEQSIIQSFSASQIPQRIGHGYEPEHSATLPPISWLKDITSFKSF